MVQPLSSQPTSTLIYPESDGKPMADNTKQFRWIVVIKENLKQAQKRGHSSSS